MGRVRQGIAVGVTTSVLFGGIGCIDRPENNDPIVRNLSSIPAYDFQDERKPVILEIDMDKGVVVDDPLDGVELKASEVTTGEGVVVVCFIDASEFVMSAILFQSGSKRGIAPIEDRSGREVTRFEPTIKPGVFPDCVEGEDFTLAE